MILRSAEYKDAATLSDVHHEIFVAGKRQQDSTPELFRTTYLDHPDKLRVTGAFDDAGIGLGFQSLRIATEGNQFGTPVGWGIIGTHIRPSAARRGIGKKLLASSLEAAEIAGLTKIEALIDATNAEGLAYYEAMGFRTYKETDVKVGKVFNL